ncbi:MAG: hypothetical protein ACUVTM_07750 [Candidatus Bathyarchaeia archaeon]
MNRIRKYEKLIGKYVKTLKSELDKGLNVDEMKVKFSGGLKWLWKVMDKDTQYRLASNTTEKRETEESR